MEYLQKHPKTGIYLFRRPVPASLRAIIGKREIKRSLKTRDPSEAKARIKAVSLEVERAFQKAGNGSVLDLESAQALADRFLQWAFEYRAKGGLTAPGLPMQSRSELEAALEEFLDDVGQPIRRSSPDFELLKMSTLIEHEREFDLTRSWRAPLEERELTRAARSAWAQLSSGKEVSAQAYSGTAGNKDADARSLRWVFEQWAKERDPSRKTRIEYEGIVARFDRANPNKTIADLTKADIRDFKDLLLSYPRSVSKEMQHLAPQDLVASLRDSESVPRLSRQTVVKHIGAIRTLLNWARGNDYLQNNPADGIKVARPKYAPPERLPYDDDDLERIFTSPLFVGCASVVRRNVPGTKVYRDSKFWLPLLALFTGARLEELGQLMVSDVRKDDGIWTIDINDNDEGKSLKNRSSVRKVPLHPVLIDIGFIDVKWPKEGWLFDDLTPSARTGRRTDSFSKYWERYARKIGVLDRRKVFHSFRHAFKDACRNAGVDYAAGHALTGHAAQNVGDTYGAGHSLASLHTSISRIRFPSVDWTTLVGA